MKFNLCFLMFTLLLVLRSGTLFIHIYMATYIDSREFTERDVEVFRRYLTFCGIGIQNAQLFEMSVQEYRRNQILLNLARSIFEEQNNLECLVTKILTEARELLKCERCTVFLLDLDCCESVSHIIYQLPIYAIKIISSIFSALLSRIYRIYISFALILFSN